ncbi:MAG: pseudouridine synthase [Fusobacteriaceae bacterium]
MRINKFLALKGIASRREIDRLIESNEIKVNGELATSGMKISEDDKIEISGKKIKFQESQEKKVYFLLNKPEKVLSASKDDRGRKTVIDLIKCEQRIFPIGRLDYDTEGAIILTNDGELFNKIIHPRTEVYKEYEALVRGYIDDKKLSKLQEGVSLEDGVTLPAKASILSRDTLKSAVIIAIREGRNRQIRRMFDAIGNRVEKLKRLKIGEIGLKGLKVGMYRELTEEEVKYLYSLGE